MLFDDSSLTAHQSGQDMFRSFIWFYYWLMKITDSYYDIIYEIIIKKPVNMV